MWDIHVYDLISSPFQKTIRLQTIFPATFYQRTLSSLDHNHIFQYGTQDNISDLV